MARAVGVITEVAARLAALTGVAREQVAIIAVEAVLAEEEVVVEEERLIMLHHSRRKLKRLVQSCEIRIIPPIGRLVAMFLLPPTE